MNHSDKTYQARMYLVEMGGQTSQDLGMGRIVGQVLVYLYLQPSPSSLDELENELGLSKASVSIAARQLEQLGLLRRVWVKGDRKNYYRSADNIAQALQQGLQTFFRQKVLAFGGELQQALDLLEEDTGNINEEKIFLKKRISRAFTLQQRIEKVLNNPIWKFFTGSSQNGKTSNEQFDSERMGS